MNVIFRIVLVVTAIAALAGCSKKEPSGGNQPSADTITKTQKPVGITPATTVASAAEETVVTQKTEVIETVKDTVETVTKEPVEYADSGIGMKAPALTGLEWIKGKPVKIETGKVYIVEFWATWCPPCRKSIPHLTELQKQYPDTLTIIGVSAEEPSVIRPFVTEKGDEMDYTVAADLEGTVKNNYSQAFNQKGIPHAFIIDQHQRIVWLGHPTFKGIMDETVKLVLEGDYDPLAAAKAKAEQEALDKQLHEWLTQYSEGIQTQGISEENTRIANLLIEKAHWKALNALVWSIVMLEDKEKRQLDIALKAAEKSIQLTGNKNPFPINTYARVLFEYDKTSEAIDYQQKAIKLLPEGSRAIEGFTKTLEKYRAALDEAK